MKKRTGIIVYGILLFPCLSCSSRYDGPPADLVIKNAKVVTIYKKNSRAEAVAMSGEFIVGVGSN